MNKNFKRVVSLIIAALLLVVNIPIYASETNVYQILLYEDFKGETQESLISKGWVYPNDVAKTRSSIASDFGYGDEYALRIDREIKEDGTLGSSLDIRSYNIPVTPDTIYTVTANMYMEKGHLGIRLAFYDENNNSLSYKSAYTTNDYWTEVIVDAVAPAGASYARFSIAMNNDMMSTGYCDNVTFIEGATESHQYDVLYYKDFKNETYENMEIEGWTFSQSYSKKYSEFSSDFGCRDNYSFKIDRLVNENGTLGPTIALTSPCVEVTPGELYTASADIYMEKGHLGIRFYFLDEDKKSIEGAYLSDYTTSNYWENISNSMVAPENARYAQITYTMNTDMPSTGYYDNMMFTRGIVWPKDTDVVVKAEQANPQDGYLVKPDGNKLTYNAYNNESGDKLSDFSYAGFYEGKFELPNSENLPIAAVISPSKIEGTDDTARIQSIINSVAAKSSDDVFTVIKLEAGRYYINNSGLNMKSGIILSGEGQGPDGTVLYSYKETDKNLKSTYTLNIVGSKNNETAEPHYIKDEYVKAGSREFTIDEEEAKSYSVGDIITIHSPQSEEWFNAMEMSGITNPDGIDTSWTSAKMYVVEDRTITGIDGGKITVDMPFYVPYKTSLTNTYIYKTDDSKKIRNVGIENLRFESYFNGSPEDEKHATFAINTAYSKDCYVRDVSSKYYAIGLFQASTGAKRITVKNCSCLEPISTNAGTRKYSFSIGSGAQQILITGCYSYNGRHDYVATNKSVGPVVFSDNVADSTNADSETHGLWATGTLYDNVYQIGLRTGALSTSNYGKQGSATTPSFGWTGAGSVFYNCLSPAITAVKPRLTYNNFMIGQWGYYNNEDSKERAVSSKSGNYRTSKYPEAPEGVFVTEEGTSFIGDGYKEASFAPVEPRSLYKAQLAERITGNFRNVRPNAPIISNPRGEIEHKLYSNNVSINGLYEKGAEKVTLYIDNEEYDATLNNSDFTFNFNITLEDGTHKLYATQTIDGVESTKTADRFIIINNSSANADYLQSDYEYDKIHSVLNDDIVSFDVYQNTLNGDDAGISYDEATGKINVISDEDASLYVADYEEDKVKTVKIYDIIGSRSNIFDFDSSKRAFVWNDKLQPLSTSFAISDLTKEPTLEIVNLNDNKLFFKAENAESFDLKVVVEDSEYVYNNPSQISKVFGKDFYKLDLTSVIKDVATRRQANREIYTMYLKTDGTEYIEFYNQMAIYEIAVPQNLKVEYTYDTSTDKPDIFELSWDKVKNSSKYILTVFKTDALDEADIILRKELSATSDTVELTSMSISELENGVFTVQSVIEGVPSDYSVQSILLKRPTITGVSYDTDAYKYKVSYNKVAGATGYKVRFNGVEVATDTDGDTSTLFEIPASTVGFTGKVEVMAFSDFNISVYNSYVADIAFAGKETVKENGQNVTYNLIADERNFKNIGTNAQTLSENYKQIRDIDGVTAPIGDTNNAFSGVYDGGNNTITADIVATTATDIGLFAKLSGATIKNLKTAGEITNTTQVKNVAGIAGSAVSSSFENVENGIYVNLGAVIQNNNTAGFAGDATGGCVFVNCVNNGKINAKYESASGFVGRGGGTFTDCVNYAEIASKNGVAAFVGTTSENVLIDRCANLGFINGIDSHSYYIGGFIAHISSGNITIKNSYNDAPVELFGGNNGADAENETAAAFIGRVSSKSKVDIVIENCYNSCTVKAFTNQASLVGWIASPVNLTVKNYYDIANTDLALTGDLPEESSVTTENVYIEDPVALRSNLPDGFSEDVWMIELRCSYKYPQLINNPHIDKSDDGSSAENPILISTADEFKTYFTSGGENNSYIGDGLFFKQTANINLGEYEPDRSGNAFTGTYDGGGYTLSYKISSTSGNKNGLFANAWRATFKNMDVTIDLTTSSDHHYNGGIVADGCGCIFENCISRGTLNTKAGGNYNGGILGGNSVATESNVFINCVNHADLPTKYAHQGGIAGTTFGTFSNCVNYGSQITTNGGDIGGILGRAYHKNVNTKDGYKAETVIINCANYGKVGKESQSSNSSNFGGILAYAGGHDSVTIEKCFNQGRITGFSSDNGECYLGGIFGVLGADMNDGGKFTITDCYNAGNVQYIKKVLSVSYTDTKQGNTWLGAIMGANLANTGAVTISTTYDSVNSKQNVICNDKVKGTENTSTAYIIGKNITSSQLETAITDGKLSSDVWQIKSDYTYPQLISNPHTK